jgi:hypothetical protein
MDQLKLFDTPQTQRTSDDYWTPKWIFDSLGLTFDLDVACPPEGPAHTPCKSFYTQADDGLAQPWDGLVFMNPPFSKTTPWVEKWINHGNGIALLPCLKHSQWTKTLWNSRAKSLWINEKQIHFHHKGKEQPIWTIVWLWGIGEQATQALHDSNLGQVR